LFYFRKRCIHVVTGPWEYFGWLVPIADDTRRVKARV
jgi:hypothetical protein